MLRLENPRASFAEIATDVSQPLLRYLQAYVGVLHDLDGLTMAETANVSGCTLPTAKIRIHRARLRLKQALRQQCDFYGDGHDAPTGGGDVKQMAEDVADGRPAAYFGRPWRASMRRPSPSASPSSRLRLPLAQGPPPVARGPLIAVG